MLLRLKYFHVIIVHNVYTTYYDIKCIYYLLYIQPTMIPNTLTVYNVYMISNVLIVHYVYTAHHTLDYIHTVLTVYHLSNYKVI